MNPRLALAALTVPLALGLTSCSAGSGSPGYSYQDVTVSISPTIASLPVNGAQTFTSSTQNAPNYPNWFTQPDSPGTPNGSIQSTAGTDTALYTAPATPPIYTPAQLAAGAVQGQVTIIVLVSNSRTNVLSDASATQTFTITAPSITTGISPATATVAVGSTQQFAGYAVGSLNSALTWQVNGVAGGSTANGTISTSGLYTAPSAVPMAGPTVTVSAVSAGDPTKSSSALVTIH
jgi:hypothetical protein